MLRRRRRPRRWRAQHPLYLLPNIFTIMGLCAGLTGIRYALDSRWELAVGLIVLAGVLDGLDGRSARLLNIQSRLGAELDSLADFLSFGVAPAVLVYLWSLNGVRGIGWALALVFATCCALRLARFNSEIDKPDRPPWMTNYFAGIPAPGGAGLAMLPMILHFASGYDWLRSWTVNAIVVFGVAVMMVSTVPTPSIKRMRVRPAWVLPTLLLAGLMVAFLATEPWMTLSVVGLIYVLSLPLAVVSALRAKRRSEDRAASGAQAPAAPQSSSEPADTVVSMDRRSGTSPRS